MKDKKPLMDHAEFWRALSRYGADDVPVLMKAAAKSRGSRVEAAFRDAAGDAGTTTDMDQLLFNRMWLGADLDGLNRELRADLDGLNRELRADLDGLNRELRADLEADLATVKAHHADSAVLPKVQLYCLTRNMRLISLYHCFGAASRFFPGRLAPENEALLLELLWWRTAEKNDIATARKSTWWIGGSENHDLNTKVTNLLASAIFAHEPGYAGNALPNKGHGMTPGHTYVAGFNPLGVHDPARTGTERADWADGRAYTPADHLQAWIAFFMAYFRERAKKGFFLENGAPGYMRYTLSYILTLHAFCPDDGLREQVRKFLDLFWADWALQQIAGLRGGPKTRHHCTAGGYDAMSDYARFYLGGPGAANHLYAQQLISDYAWDSLSWELVLDRQGLGCFAYVSRGIGEEEETCPRPFGVERTMTGDRESRMVKYAWVTPDYILGTQMDHPLAVHNHLSAHGRWQGLICSDPDSRIVTVSLTDFPGKMHADDRYNLEFMYHSVQDRQVLVTQQRRRWQQINPDWFPTYDNLHDVELGIFIGSGWQNREERDGWLFVEQGDTYAAIRILRLKTDPDPLSWAKGTDRYANTVVLDESSYAWNDAHTILRLENRYSPIIIEAGRRADHPTMEDFQRRILASKLDVYKTVATHETEIIIVYKGIEAREIVFNAANPADIPTIAGTPVDYRHPKTFDAPYLQSDYDSAVVTVWRGERSRVLDFGDQESKSF